MEMEQIGAIVYIIWWVICLVVGEVLDKGKSWEGKWYRIFNIVASITAISVILPFVIMMVVGVVILFGKVLITALGINYD